MVMVAPAGLREAAQPLTAPLSLHSHDICIYKNKPCGTLGTYAPWAGRCP